MKHLRNAPDGRKLTPAHKAVLGQLADDHNEDKSCAWPSIGNLAKRACMSREYCRRLLRELETMGIIERNPRLRDNGSWGSCEYRFCQIDPPFDAELVAKTSKELKMRAAKRAARPVQMKLAGEGGIQPQLDRVSNSSRTGYPTAVGQGIQPQLDRVSNPSRIPELLTEPLGQPLSELPLEPKGTTPTPPHEEGFEAPAVESEDKALDDRDMGGWSLFKTRLKFGLRETPLGAGKGRFTEIRKGEDDYDAAFRDWRLVGRRDERDRIVLVTRALDLEATRQGLKKYSTRLAETAAAALRNVRGRKIEFEVEGEGAGIDLAASAEPPKKGT